MNKCVVLSGIILFILLYSCNEEGTRALQTGKLYDTASCLTETIKDPNNPKPMALAMRAMATNADSMRYRLISGESLDSAAFPFIRFYLAEPTDSSVLEPRFYDNARLFQESYLAIFSHQDEGIRYYNAMIGACIHCHESYCSGPLKRIKKLPI